MADLTKLILALHTDVTRGFRSMNVRLDGHDDRLDRIEAKQEQHDRRFVAIDDRFDRMDARLDAHDERFEQIDRRFDGVDQRFDGIDEELRQIKERLGVLEAA